MGLRHEVSKLVANDPSIPGAGYIHGSALNLGIQCLAEEAAVFTRSFGTVDRTLSHKVEKAYKLSQLICFSLIDASGSEMSGRQVQNHVHWLIKRVECCVLQQILLVHRV